MSSIKVADKVFFVCFCPEIYRLQDQRNVDPRVRLSSVPLPVRWRPHRRGDCELCWRCGPELMLFLLLPLGFSLESCGLILNCSLPGLSMIKVSLKKDGHYFCTHVSQATVEAAGPEPLQDSEDEGNSDVTAWLSAKGNVWPSLCAFLACRHSQTEARLLHGAAGQRRPPVLQRLRPDGRTHWCVGTHSIKSYFVPPESRECRASPDLLPRTLWYFSQATGKQRWFFCDAHARLGPNRPCWFRSPAFIGMNSWPSLCKHRAWFVGAFANVISVCHCRRAESGRCSTAWTWRCQVGCCCSFCRRTHQVGIVTKELLAQCRNFIMTFL